MRFERRYAAVSVVLEILSSLLTKNPASAGRARAPETFALAGEGLASRDSPLGFAEIACRPLYLGPYRGLRNASEGGVRIALFDWPFSGCKDLRHNSRAAEGRYAPFHGGNTDSNPVGDANAPMQSSTPTIFRDTSTWLG